jgi:hypothetical protein
MKKILIITALMWTLFSCSDKILDISPKDRIAEDAVWKDEKLINAYENELYNAIQHGLKLCHMQSKATDEAICTITFDIGQLPAGAINADNITSVANTAWNCGGNIYYWNTGWQYVRKINIFLEKMESLEITIDNKERLVAEAKFLRAFIYFEFIKRFGGVPIITQSYELASATDVSFTRNTFDECVKFIDDDLAAAIPDLPEKYTASDANFGRATQDVCKALRSRLYLYVASPLWNPSNDQQKWQKAADAAAALLNSGYSLYSDYSKLFNQPSGTANSELIWARTFSATNYQQAPMHNLGRRYGAYGGWWASNGPSQNLVDDYDMTNGEPPFIWVDGVKTDNPASGYDPQHPYLNRDPRFYSTIIYDGAVYHGDLHEMWIASDGNTWGYDSFKQSSDNPRGDYILRKFMPEDEPLNWQEHYTQPWPIFRLAEIYLNYAEAKFELGDEATCREYISKVRERVGMPEIPVTVTGEDLRARLYNERRIEMAFEEQRFWDLRRWKIAMDVENRPLYGMQIIKDINTGVKTYTPVKYLNRTFLEKMYLLPIETNEILKTNGTLTQTTGW